MIVFLAYKPNYPIAVISEAEWFEEREVAIDIPVPAPYLHIGAFFVFFSCIECIDVDIVGLFASLLLG